MLRLHQSLSAVMVLAVMVVIGTGSLAAFYFMLNAHSAEVKEQLAHVRLSQTTTKGKDISATTSQLNTTIISLAIALGTPRSWASDTAVIEAGLPSAVTITSLTINVNGSFRLVGTADSRQSFVQLQEALTKNAKLKDVTTKSTASKRVDVPFDFTGTLLTTAP